jgi:hypothetical protein
MRIRVAKLTAIYNKYMDVPERVEEAIGDGVIEQLGLFPDKVIELCNGIVQSNRNRAYPSKRICSWRDE